MTKRAYVLIETETGKATTVAEALRGKPEITVVDVVTGPHDVIAILQGADAEAVARIVINDIHIVEGIRRTTTHMAISTSPSGK